MTAKPRRLLAWLLGLAWCASPADSQSLPQKYALLIGLNHQLYEGVQVQMLKYAAADVDELQKILEQPAFGFTVTPLRDSKATREEIVTELRHFARIAKPQDTFLLYFAGHGVRDTTNGQTYWLTYNASLIELDVHAIRLRHLLEYVREIPAQRKLIILDHCYSGDIIATLEGGVGRDAAGAAREAGIPLSSERSLVPRDLPPEVNGVLQSESTSTGLTVLAASRGAAYELDPPVGHGLFTSILVQALTTPDADTLSTGETRGDLKLTVRELARYVGTQIRDRSKVLGKPQEPLESLQGQDLDSWFLGNLPAGTASQSAKISDYQKTLISWRGRHLISGTTALSCSTKLSNWESALQAGTTVGPEIQRVVDAVEDAMSSTAPEQDRAAYLETTIKVLLQENTP